jgi:hypothetical protein
VFFHLDTVCWADINARPACDTCNGIPKGRCYLSFVTPADKGDGIGTDDLTTYTLAEPAQYALIGFFYHRKPGLLNAQSFGHLSDMLGLGGPGEKQLQDHSAGAQNVLGSGGNLYTGIHRIVTGGSHPRAPAFGHLYQTETACPIRGDGLMIAEVGDVKTILKGYGQKHLPLFSLNLKTIDLKLDEFLLRHHSTFTASTGQTSLQVPHLMHFAWIISWGTFFSPVMAFVGHAFLHFMQAIQASASMV